MASAPFDIIAGPATVWLAPVGEAFPAIGAAVAGNFVSLGRTEGGVTVTHNESIELLRVDQDTGPVKAIRSEESLVIEFSLAELTLERYALILNNATVTDNASSDREFPLRAGLDVDRRALLARGDLSPYESGNLQYEVPIVVQTGSPAISFVRDDKSVLGVEFTAIEDPAAASAAERFGVLRAAEST